MTWRAAKEAAEAKLAAVEEAAEAEKSEIEAKSAGAMVEAEAVRLSELAAVKAAAVEADISEKLRSPPSRLAAEKAEAAIVVEERVGRGQGCCCRGGYI